jgi:ATP-dependent Clp protease, protease subunit
MAAASEVVIAGEITDDTAASVRAQLKLASRAPRLDVVVSSFGGSVTAGWAITAALRQHPGRKHARVEGVAASIASAIVAAADRVTVTEGSLMMVHQPYSTAGGTAADLRRTAEVLDRVQADLVALYVRRTGKPEADVVAWLQAETWFNAEEAVAAGFADAVEGAPVRLAAHFDPARYGFKNMPAVLARPRYQAAATLLRR